MMKRRLSVSLQVFVQLAVVACCEAATEYALVGPNGLPLRGGNVCFYRVPKLGKEWSPAAYWFTGKDVRCLPADMLLDLPIGGFHFFGTHPDGFISRRRETLESFDLAPEASYKKILIDIVPAGVLDFSDARTLLQEDEYFAAWVGDADQTTAFLIPMIPESSRISVPAGRIVLPMLISHGAPRMIADAIQLKAGQRSIVRFRPPATGTGDLVTWIEARFDPGAIRNLAALSTATVEAVDKERRYTAVPPLEHSTGMTSALQVFRNVPAGPVTVRLTGKTWETDEIDAVVVNGQVTVTSAALTAVPAGSATVRYRISQIEGTRVQRCPEAKDPRDDDTIVQFSAYRCADTKRPTEDGYDLTGCTDRIVQRVPLSETLSETMSAELPGLRAGHYIFEASHPALGRPRKYAFIAQADSLDIELDATAVAVFGRVTRAGKPASNVKLTFHEDTANVGIAVTNEHGEFAAFVPQDPGTWPAQLVACDDTFRYKHAPEERQAGTPYNVDIPMNSLSVTVRDAMSGSPIAGARVRYALTEDETERNVLSAESQTADDLGIATFETLPAQRKMHVCATFRGYDRACAPMLTLKNDEQRSLALSLVRDKSKRGRVLGLKIEIGRVFWINEVTGLTSEVCAVPMGADGAFNCKVAHTPEEYVVLASTNQPLMVVPRTNIQLGDEIIINVAPPPALRSFDIVIESNDTEKRFVTLSIGGRIVPLNAFIFHMNNRRRGSEAAKGRPVRVIEVADAGPITVHALAFSRLVPGEQRYADLFSLPEYSSLIQRQVARPGAATVVFP